MEENTLDPSSEDSVVVEEAESEDVLLSEKGRKYLNQTGPWVRFLSVIIFISVGFMMLGGLAIVLVGMTGAFLGKNNPVYDVMPGGSFAVGIVYVVAALLYVAPGLFLVRYASSIKKLNAEPSSLALENALKYQKSFWRYIGVITVILLVFVAAALAFTFTLGFFMALNR